MNPTPRATASLGSNRFPAHASRVDPPSIHRFCASLRPLLPLLPLVLLLAFSAFTVSASGLSEIPAAPNVTATSACDPITTDTLWSSGVYTGAECSILVPAGVTLTIQAGVVVKLGSISPKYGYPAGSTALIVDGALIVQGTAAQPVIFTSLADDAQGGDTNGDGDSVGAAGDWYGLVFRSGSIGRLEHFWVGYGGSGVTNWYNSYNRAQIDVVNADVQLRNGTVTTGLRKGIYLEGDGITPVIERVQIIDNDDPTDNYNTLGYAIYQSTVNMQPSYAELTFSGNDRDEVTIGNFGGALTTDVTLGGTNYGFTCGYSLCLLTVPNSTTLTIEPGTLLDFRPSFGIAVGDGGGLVAQGTVTQPITFTSRLAEAASAASQQWMGLWAQQGSTLRLDQCDISYASNTNFGLGGLEINTDDAQVSNCRIHHNAQNGLYLYSRDGSTIHPMLENVDVTDNGQTGVFLDASNASSLSVTWDGGSISRNGWSGVEDSTWNSTINPTFRNLTINGNGWLNEPYGLRKQGIAFDNHNVNPVLENITLTDNVGAAMNWYCNGSITASGLTATGNGGDEVVIPGCALWGGRQWDLGDAGIPVRVSEGIVLNPNALLSIMPGTTLRFDRNANGYGTPPALQVNDQSALYALGTVEKPIVFTGAKEEAGWWGAIEADDRAVITLNHCEIGYGGGGNRSGILIIRKGASGGTPATNIQNCEIHHSSKQGVYFNFYNYPIAAPLIFRNNSLHDIATEAIVNLNAPVLDARSNWWGDASGPQHPTQNPSGLGEPVGNNITFYPWLGTEETGQTVPGEMLVSTGAPRLVSPGQTVDYAVQFVNGMTTTIQNPVLLVQLPRSAEYVESGGGGIYWPERDQIFWELGDIPPGGQGHLSFVLRFAWGLPGDYSDSSITLFSGENYKPEAFDRQPYLDFQPGAVNGVSLLSTAAFQSQLAASPALQAAYDTALAAGYTFHSAATVSRSEGESVLEGVLVKANQRQARILSLESGNLLVYTITSGEVTVEEIGGGMRIDLLTGEKSLWGSWAEPTVAGATAQTGCTPDACKRNCRWTIVGWEYIKKKAARIVAWTALAPFTGGGSVAGAVWEVGSTVKKLYDCDLDCRANPSTYCCTAGQVRWSGSGLWDRLTNSCFKEKCNATTGLWVPDGYKTCVAFGQRCVTGIGGDGCVECEERSAAQRGETRTVSVGDSPATAQSESECSATGAGGKPRCRDLELFLAKDPNAIYGFAGDLLPGQAVSYTVTYENEGPGRAYGVYVINPLPAVFDESTLNLYEKGVYVAGSREIFWPVGELGPKGAADSTGAITYTVALTSGLASGTVVSNQAVVYFASVPEETPTNSWVNLVSPLVAIPQQVETGYMTPLPITLSGKEVSSLPLSYAVVEQPHGGTLSGTLPELTYTPLENFTGPDSFTFRVSNDTSTSRAAQVQIEVTAAGDTTPPTVVWTSPAADAKDVVASASPVFTDTAGPVYAPVIVIGVSEALSETTISTATVVLADSVSAQVTGTVRFDGAVNQIVLAPLVALEPGQYTVTVATGIADMAGNGLAAPHILIFTVNGDQAGWDIYLPALHK